MNFNIANAIESSRSDVLNFAIFMLAGKRARLLGCEPDPSNKYRVQFVFSCNEVELQQHYFEYMNGTALPVVDVLEAAYQVRREMKRCQMNSDRANQF